MEQKTRNVYIHNGVFIVLTALFIVYFGAVENSIDLRLQIDENIEIIPIGQLLAYEGYAGFVILKQIRLMQENKKIKHTVPNVVVFGGHVFHEYATTTIDLIGITIITFSFFIYAYPKATTVSSEIMGFSNVYFLILVPIMGLVVQKLLSIKKLEYV